MLTSLFKLVSLPVIGILLLFNLRRVVLTLALFFAPRRSPPALGRGDLPAVLVLVPCRDEEAMIPGLVQALRGLDYPSDKLVIVLIDDGSQDRTRAVLHQFVRGAANMHVLALPENLGKARALNAALARFAFGEIVYVFDADHRPRADALRRAVGYFCSPEVAGVSGRTVAANALASPSAYYAAVENTVHQMLTMRAKDRLDLAPALLGSNCGYRRAALVRCGGFRDGALLEDSDLTVRLSRAGYRLRFAEDAIAYAQVPETRTGYVNQHARWARGYNDIAREHTAALMRQSSLRPALRLELVLFALGYMDRVALLMALVLAALARLNPRRFRFPGWVLGVALLTPVAQIVALFAEQRVPAGMWLRLPLVPLVFALDVYAALRAALDSLLRRRRIWKRTDRVRP